MASIIDRKQVVFYNIDQIGHGKKKSFNLSYYKE